MHVNVTVKTILQKCCTKPYKVQGQNIELMTDDLSRPGKKNNNYAIFSPGQQDIVSDEVDIIKLP